MMFRCKSVSFLCSASLESQVTNIQNSLDGYALSINLNILDDRELQHQNETDAHLNTIIKDLDGYALLVVENQRWEDSSQQRQDIRDVLDGYTLSSEFQGLVNTESEHHVQHSDVIQTIIKDLDGYATQISLDTANTNLNILDVRESEHYTENLQTHKDIVSILDG